MWTTTPPPISILKPGWTTDPTLILGPVEGTQEWGIKYSRRLSVGVSPQVDMNAGGRAPAGLGLVLTPGIGMVGAGRSPAQFGMVLSPQIGMVLPPPIPTDFGLIVTPSLEMSASEHYARALQLAASPGFGFAAAEHYARNFGLTLTPQIGQSATWRRPGSFNLGLTPSLEMTGIVPPVTFDNSSNGGSGGTSTRSWTHNNQGNCIVVMLTNTTSSNPTCTYGGVSIPRVYGPNSDGGVFPYTSYISIYALVSNSLPKGNNTVSVNQAGTASAAGAVSFYNAASVGAVSGDTASGNVNKAVSPGANGASVAAYVGGSNNFGAISPNQVMREGFTAFVTWATVMGWGLGNVTFTSTHSGAKTGATVLILPLS